MTAPFSVKNKNNLEKKKTLYQAKTYILHSAGWICRLLTFSCVHRALADTQGMGMQTEQRLWERGAEQKLVLCSTFMLAITCNLPCLN